MKLFSYRCVVEYGEFGGVIIADSEEEAREIIKNNEKLIREREAEDYDIVEEFLKEIPMEKGYTEISSYIE